MITTLIFYLKKSENSMASWIILLTPAKNSNFSDFYCISKAVTNIILYIAWQLEHDGVILYLI